MHQLIRKHYPDLINEFWNSDQWFKRFCCRFKVSLRRKTQPAQRSQQKQKLFLANFTNIYCELDKERSINLQILLTWIKQDHHLQLMMTKLMKQIILKMHGGSQVNHERHRFRRWYSTY